MFQVSHNALFRNISQRLKNVFLDQNYFEFHVREKLFIFHYFKFQIISSLDVLNKLSQVETNETFIASLLSDQTSIYDKLVSYLSLHDIHLLISTLECLYAISCHGEVTCNAIARTHGALETLVSLVTVEAQSYGPKACILMRVVETVPGSNPTAMHPQQTQLQPLAAPQTTVQTTSALTVTPATNGLKPDQLAQLGQLTPIRPGIPEQPQQQQQQQQQMVTMAVSQPQQVPMMSQQGVIRGQLVQVPTSQQQQMTPVMHLQRQQVNVLRPGQPTTVVVNQPQQQQQIQIQQKGQMGGGSIIITTTPNSIHQQQYQQQTQQLQIVQQQPMQQMQLQQVQQQQQIHIQQPQQQQQQQLQTVYQQQQQLQQAQQQIRPTIVQGMVRPAMQVQQQQLQQAAHPAGSQQVQLRVSNDDSNRQFCLSWLKATYELCASGSIDQQVMYKQYLASLHKLGKREVISAQHYAVCVR